MNQRQETSLTVTRKAIFWKPCRRMTAMLWSLLFVIQFFIIGIFIYQGSFKNYVYVQLSKYQKVNEEHFDSTLENCLIRDTSEPAPKPKCPVISPYLIGYRKPVMDDEIHLVETLQKYRYAQCGGQFRPSNCEARQKAALLVPFRDRQEHLKIFINHMHPFLMRQQLEYKIYIIDLDKEIRFNRGVLLNVGFLEASKEADFDCYFLHDVDLLPEHDHNLYRCSELPRHMSVAVDKFNYRLPYLTNFGGVSAMTKDQILFVNGFSNKFSGWGGEDDDLYNRLIFHNMTVLRSMPDVSRYIMLKHDQSPPNAERFKLLRTGMERVMQDGIKNLKYKISNRTDYLLFTYINISF
ncbi:beta-1,4-galactosyltransferase 1-like [Saccostrea cucullata]|uniref:beta-1,4-galactosyltransferase 1-like n=1 Tax=Saccostrea cuccullata TaxID=36930 RepID=UPI002ED04E89